MFLHTLLLLSLFLPRSHGDEVDLSNSHYPMVYVSPLETEAYFNTLVPRNQTYVFRATPLNVPHAKPIEAEILGAPIQDNQGLLHDHVLKVRFAGLNPATAYKLEILTISKFGQTVVDQRTFSTFDNSPKSLKFVTGSCMSDEMRYEKVRQKIAANMIGQKPELIVLMGDQVYVDSFDYVARDHATELDIWMRYFRSFQVNPLFRSAHLIPTITTWDDHDTGVDNGNKHTPTISDARRAFKALFSSPDIAGVIENGKDGVQSVVSVRGQNFILLDNRSFRSEPDSPESPDSNDRYGHLGQAQEEWMLKQLNSKKGFFWLVDGGMWGSEVVTQTHHDGTQKRMTEGFHADHPVEYREVMKAVNASGAAYAMISGDIHFTQFIEHGPEHADSPRGAPFKTLEIVSSPLFSIIFPPGPGEPALWKDPQRITGVKDYNFVLIASSLIPNGLSLTATSIGTEGRPFFSYGARIETSSAYESVRRKILTPKEEIKAESGKVKVAFFDADSTLRIAKSGHLSANSPTDVILLPGVADKIAELVKEGFFIAIVSNQQGITDEHISFNGDSSYEGKFKIADQALQYVIELIQKENPAARVHYMDFAEGEDGDYYRKPNIGMGKNLERVLEKEGLEIDRTQSFMVGDSLYKQGEVAPDGKMGDASSDSDRKFAENLGIRHRHPQEVFGWSDQLRAAIVKHDPQALASALACGALLQK